MINDREYGAEHVGLHQRDKIEGLARLLRVVAAFVAMVDVVMSKDHFSATKTHTSDKPCPRRHCFDTKRRCETPPNNHFAASKLKFPFHHLFPRCTWAYLSDTSSCSISRVDPSPIVSSSSDLALHAEPHADVMAHELTTNII